MGKDLYQIDGKGEVIGSIPFVGSFELQSVGIKTRFASLNGPLGEFIGLPAGIGRFDSVCWLIIMSSATLAQLVEHGIACLVRAEIAQLVEQSPRKG